MNVLFLLAVIAAPIRMSSAFVQQQEAPPTRIFVGVVGDFACGLKHTMHPNLPEVECGRLCHSLGSRLDLIMGDKFYALEGNTSELLEMLGQKAIIRGSLNEKTRVITVAEVMNSKKRLE